MSASRAGPMVPQAAVPGAPPPGPSTLRDQFVLAMSRAAQTVNVVTTDGPLGRAGVTVSAMASVTADTPKPTLLVCVNQSASAAPLILGNGRFVVNVLRDDQTHVADVFAGRHRDRLANRFDVTGWTAMQSGLPRAEGALVAFDCRLASSTLVGTHHVLFGEVEEVHVAPAGRPLIYAHRAYGSPTWIDPPPFLPARPAGPVAGQADRLSIACYHSFGPVFLPGLLRRLSQDGPLEVSVIEGDQRRVEAALASGEVELALMSDTEAGPETVTLPLARMPFHVLLPAQHPLAMRPGLSAADLAQEPMVLLATPGDQALRMMQRAGVEPRIACRAGSLEMVRGLVGQGLGFALLATRPAAAIAYDGSFLALVPFVTEAPVSRLAIAWRKGAALSPLARHFVTLAQTTLATDA